MALYGNMTLREREDKNKVRKRNEERGQDSSDASVRESRKNRKLNPLPKKLDKSSRAKYDENGCDKETGLDLCDCFDEKCPGCWMDCPGCESRKCGHECRRFRRFKYDYADIEGSNVTLRFKSK